MVRIIKAPEIVALVLRSVQKQIYHKKGNHHFSVKKNFYNDLSQNSASRETSKRIHHLKTEGPKSLREKRHQLFSSTQNLIPQTTMTHFSMQTSEMKDTSLQAKMHTPINRKSQRWRTTNSYFKESKSQVIKLDPYREPQGDVRQVSSNSLAVASSLKEPDNSPSL